MDEQEIIERIDNASPEELENLAKGLGYGSPQADGKQTVHTFLHNVATAEDTTKLGYLRDEEIGIAINPTRAFKHMANFAEQVMDEPDIANFFRTESEIITSTSLSREAMLLKLAVTTKRELADVTKERKVNKGWFRKKDKEPTEEAS